MFLAAVLAAGLAWGETLEMVTYYPAPGSASASQDLHVRSITVGLDYATETPGDGEALVFDRLGVGTNAPVGPLHVVGVDDALSSVVFVPGADTATAGTPAIRVGIGTATPQVPLEVHQVVTAASHTVASFQSGHPSAWIDFVGQNTTLSPLVGVLGVPNSASAPENTLQIQVGGAGRLTIPPDGNVGIGTGAPTADPSPGNGQATANLDVNDIWLRAANAGAGAWMSAGAGGGATAAGSYTGNGAASRNFDIGFQPSKVEIFGYFNGKTAGTWMGKFEKTAGMPNNLAYLVSDPPGPATLRLEDTRLNLRADGFSVGFTAAAGYTTNQSGIEYDYVAYR